MLNLNNYPLVNENANSDNRQYKHDEKFSKDNAWLLVSAAIFTLTQIQCEVIK